MIACSKNNRINLALRLLHRRMTLILMGLRKWLLPVTAITLVSLVAACGGGGGGITGTPPPPPPPPPPSPSPPPPPPAGAVTLSGTLSYEFPAPKPDCRGINLDNPQLRPIRQATVRLLNPANRVIVASQLASDVGGYAFTVDGSTNFIISVMAELKAANWDVEIRDNVDTSATPVPLAQRPIYAMEQSINSGGANNSNLNFTAATGWGGSSYTGTRVAAPFAILDSIYSAMQFVIAEDSSANFPALDVFWNPNNQEASPSDIAMGDLPTSFYNGDDNSLLLLGSAEDADEFDDHVVVHEWGHYFEDNFSRSDSIGGSHGLGDNLDMRTAFGEGWASALAGMALNDPLYCDTRSETSGGGFSAETTTGGEDGWFNEFTIIRFIYDLWDTVDDPAESDSDGNSVGFGPIYAVMTGPQSTTEAFTSVFSFATYLKQQNTGKDGFINNLLADGGVNPIGIDIYGSTETNDGPASPQDVLDIYTDLTLGAAPINICANSQFDSARNGNRLSEHRYLRLNVPSSTSVTFTVATNPEPSQPSNGFDCTANQNDPENTEHSDPDFLVYRGGQSQLVGFSCTPNSEIATGQLAAGNYVVDLNEFRHEDDQSSGGYPERVCFDVSAN